MATRSRGSSWALPVGVAVVLGGGALWAVSQNRAPRTEAAEAATDDAPRPFDGLPAEEPPPPRDGAARAGGAAFAVAPEGLEDDEGWKKALEQAGEAEERFVKARDALSNGDRATANEEGALSRKLFDEALEDTALWEEDLLEKYGESEPQVRRIKRQRSQWFDRIRWLHKSIAR